MEFVPKSVHWLLPDEPCPCDILLHFRGQYATAISGGQKVGFRLLEKLAKTQCKQIYIREGDLGSWRAWELARHPGAQAALAGPAGEASGAPQKQQQLQQQLYGNKRAELLSFVQKTVQKRLDHYRELNNAFASGLTVLQNVVRQPSLDWYFKQFHEPPDLFNHNARVAYSLAIFCGLHPLEREEDLETVVYSALIHELEGSPAKNITTVVSQQTLALFEKRKDPIPKSVIEMIAMHDELCSGRGFPNNRKRGEIPLAVRVFTLFNHFDQYRLICQGTRRARFEKTKQLMEGRKDDYDPDLWPLFWDFWEKEVEAIS
jgi:hypothetical protein